MGLWPASGPPLNTDPTICRPLSTTERWKTGENAFSKSKIKLSKQKSRQKENLINFHWKPRAKFVPIDTSAVRTSNSPVLEASWNHGLVGLCLCPTFWFSFLWQITLLDSTTQNKSTKEAKKNIKEWLDSTNDTKHMETSNKTQVSNWINRQDRERRIQPWCWLMSAWTWQVIRSKTQGSSVGVTQCWRLGSTACTVHTVSWWDLQENTATQKSTNMGYLFKVCCSKRVNIVACVWERLKHRERKVKVLEWKKKRGMASSMMFGGYLVGETGEMAN